MSIIETKAPIKMLSCPFCGKPGVLIEVSEPPHPPYKGFQQYMPMCSDINCIAGEDGYSSDSKKVSVLKWNSRS